MKKEEEKYWVDRVQKDYERWLDSLTKKIIKEFIDATYEFNMVMSKPRIMSNEKGTYIITVKKEK